MASSDRCNECGNRLVGQTEITSNTCLACMRAAIATLREVRPEVKRLREELEELRRSLEHVARLRDAEAQGTEARRRGLPESDVPEGDDEAKIAWLDGWSQEDLFWRLAELDAVARWAVESMDVVRQVLDGDGQREASDKLGTISAKITEKIGETT